MVRLVDEVGLMQGLCADMKCPVQPVLAIPSVAGDGL
jgi:hypothetical protein